MFIGLLAEGAGQPRSQFGGRGVCVIARVALPTSGLRDSEERALKKVFKISVSLKVFTLEILR